MAAAMALLGCGGNARPREAPPPQPDPVAMARARKSGDQEISQRVARLGKAAPSAKGQSFLDGAILLDDLRRRGERFVFTLRNSTKQDISFLYTIRTFLSDGSELILGGGLERVPATLKAGATVAVESRPLKFGAVSAAIEIAREESE